MIRRSFLVFVGLLMTTSMVLSQDQLSVGSRYVKIDSEVTRKIDPDRINVNIFLSEKDFDGRVELSTMESQLAQALKDAGIDAKDRMVLNGQQQKVKNKRNSYAYKNFTVTLHSAAEVQTLFDALEANGVFSAVLGATWHSDTEKLEQELQVEAVRSAREKAVVLAGALDQKVGLPLQIIDGGTMNIGLRYDRLMYGANRASAESAELPSIDIEQITLRQTVTVYFELK